ncbi:MAG: tRNA lysidine(34) synthetase TilS [Microthrixaceae bacterium]
MVAALLARCSFPEQSEAVLAVSGGPDSTALTVLAAAAGIKGIVRHVDHGLRPDSDSEAALVEGLATTFGFAFETVRVRVAAGPTWRPVREARRRPLGPHALLGHTLDDQAETVLWFLIRGTGPEGLSAMSPERRPLLGLRRAETVALCRALDLDVVHDPMNDDPRFTRTRLRNDVLPLLGDVAGRRRPVAGACGGPPAGPDGRCGPGARCDGRRSLRRRRGGTGTARVGARADAQMVAGGDRLPMRHRRRRWRGCWRWPVGTPSPPTSSAAGGLHVPGAACASNADRAVRRRARPRRP